MTRRNYVLRWVAVLPGALICVFLVLYPIHWFVMLQYTNNADYDASDLKVILNPQTLELLMRAFLSPFILITVGAKIAPKFKFQTAIVLAIVLGVFYGVAATIVVGDIQEGLYTPMRWLNLAMTVLLCGAGMAVGLLQAHKIDRQEVTPAP